MADSNWDADALSKRYELLTLNAEGRLKELDWKIKEKPAYAVEYDAVLADFWVYNYLHGKTFLASRDALIGSLREYLGLEEQVARQVVGPKDRQAFMGHWRRKVDGMIADLEKGQ